MTGPVHIALLFLFVALGIRPAGAAEVEAVFDEANKLYEQGRFTDAAKAYENLIEGGQRSVTVYFNLGNAWFKSGQPGRAVAAYLQAERLSPRDPDIAFNLGFVRKKIAGTEEAAAPLWTRTLQALTLNEWTALTAVVFWSALILLAFAELRETMRSKLRRYAGAAAAAAVLLSVTTAAAHQRLHDRDAVIVTADAIVRSGPLEEARVLFQLRDGTEVTIEDEKSVTVGSGTQTWYQLRDGRNRPGWVRQDQLVEIR